MQLRTRKFRHHSKRELLSEDEDEYEMQDGVLSDQRPRLKTSRIINSIESDEDIE